MNLKEKDLSFSGIISNHEQDMAFVSIVNNYPVTKTKPTYHARISKQIKWVACSKPFHLFTVRAW